MSCQTLLILSPFLDQSLTIAYFLRRYRSDNIYGVTLENESSRDFGEIYHRIIPLSLINSIKSDVVFIPTGSQSTKMLLQSSDIVLGKVKLTQKALRVYNKPWVISVAADIGIPTPITWQNLADTKMFPLFYKQSQELGGGVRGIAQNERDVPLTDRDKLIFQELITGKGTYGVSFLADRGKLLVYHIHFERESFPEQGGSAVIVEEYHDSRLVEYTQRLIKTLDYSGWGLVEYKLCPRRNDFVFMEINAKFWASCEFAFRNNSTFLKLLFDIDSKEKPVRRMVFVERAIARGLPFLISHLHILPRSALQVYPGWIRRSIGSILPPVIRRNLKQLKLRLS